MMTATANRRRSALVLMALVLGMVLPLALPLPVAQAFCGSICAPGAAPILAEAGVISGGTITGTGAVIGSASAASTTAAGVSVTAGAGAANVAVASAGGATVTSSLAGTTIGAIVASVGGFFGVKALFGGADFAGQEWTPGGGDAPGQSPGWSGSSSATTWGNPNLPQWYPQSTVSVSVSGSASGVTVTASTPGGDPARNDAVQDVAIQVYANITKQDGSVVQEVVAGLIARYGQTVNTSFQAGGQVATGVVTAIAAVVVTSAPSRNADLGETGRWQPIPPSSQVMVTVTAQCSDGSIVNQSSDVVSSNGKGELPIPDAVCRPGSVMVGSKGILTTISSAGTVTDVLWDYLAPDWVPNIPKEFPDCVSGAVVCELTVKKNMPDGEVKDCFQNPGLCTGWIPAQRAGDTSYSCWFGTYRLPISNCYAYPNPGVDHVPTGDPGGKPSDPTVPAPTDDPTPSPGPTPGSPGNPSPDDPEGNRCFPSGWGMLNPVQWVYQPVKCALSWAFVPSPGTITQIQNIGTNIGTRTPFPELGSIVIWFEPPTRDSRCLDLAINFPAGTPLPQRVPILNSCDMSNPVVAWLVNNRTILSAVIWMGTLAPLAWWAWREYAPGAKGVA